MRRQEVYVIKVTQVVDDMRWDGEKILAAFQGLVSMEGAKMLIHTALRGGEVVQRVDNSIDFRFRVFYGKVKKVFKVRHPAAKRRAGKGVSGGAPPLPPGPPPDHLKGCSKGKWKGKTKGKDLAKGPKQQRAMLTPRPAPWRSMPPVEAPPFWVWAQDGVPVAAADPSLERKKPRWSTAEKREAQASRDQSVGMVLRAKPKSRATQTAPSASSRSNATGFGRLRRCQRFSAAWPLCLTSPRGPRRRRRRASWSGT